MRFCRYIARLVFAAVFFAGSSPRGLAHKNKNDSIILAAATTHPMQYYISLPRGWNKDKKWPVIVIVEAAEKEFRLNTERFVAARRQMPFIIVAPVIVTNGNHGKRGSAIYPYSTTVWDEIDKEGICSFDMNGLQTVMNDVKLLYNAEEKFYITGFEAGTHLLWAMVFHHPEQILAAVPVAGNYRSRCIDGNDFSTDKSKTGLPVRAMYGEKDSQFGKKGPIFSQWLEAKKLAAEHGYKNITEQELKDKGHVPVPEEVLSYFFSLLSKKKNN